MNTGSRKAGRPPLPANERLGERVVVRMNAADALRLERLALKLHTTPANVVRLALAELAQETR